MDSNTLLERYDKILRIRINHSYAGFFAYVTFVLNQLRYCEANNLFPVVYFGPISEDGPNAFHDAHYGDNTWDYYFEPVAGITHEDVRRRIRDPDDPLSRADVIELPSDFLWELHAYDPDSIYNYPYGHYKDVEDVDRWYEQQRCKARHFLSKYVRPKKHVLEKVEDFWQSRLKGFDVVGVHMRGSDKGAADSSPELMRIIEPQEYFPHIDRFMLQSPGGRIFLATEQSQFVEETRARYGDRVITRDVIRTKGFGSESNPFQKVDGDNYQKGEEVFIDCLLLARSDFLLRCTSAVGEYAMYFNENLECINLNHQRSAAADLGNAADTPSAGEPPRGPRGLRSAKVEAHDEDLTSDQLTAEIARVRRDVEELEAVGGSVPHDGVSLAEFAINAATVIRKNAVCLVEKFGEEILLYHPDETRTVYLNETATRIWELVDGKRSVGEIVRLIEAAFPDVPGLSGDVDEALGQLLSSGSVEVAPMLYHDLQCLSGYGDRLLDLWAAATVARLHEPGGVLAIRWDEGLQYAGFTGTYATELFSVKDCKFLDQPPCGAIPVEKYFSDTDLNDQGIVRPTSGMRQIVLRSGANWGNSCPDLLQSDLEFYELDPGITLEHVVDTYRAIARGTEPDPRLVEGIPDDIERRVGVHVRLQDKLVGDDEAAFDMSEATWRSIEQEGNRYIERCIAEGEPLFVCSDDASYREALLQRIRSQGGDAVVASPSPAHCHLAGYEALVDFFALSRCVRIVQMTKYSTFSLAAAIMGNVPLVNFYSDESDIGHRLDIWKSALCRLVAGDC